MEMLIERFLSINRRGKPAALVLIVLYVVYMDIILSIITIYHGYISLVLFLFLFLIWAYRLVIYELRKENLPGLSYSQKNIFIFFTFISVLVMNIRFSGSYFSYVLFILLSFSFFMWIIFFFLDKIAFPGREIRFYFSVIFLTIFINTGINYFLQ